MSNLTTEYSKFVDELLSKPSSEFGALIERLKELDSVGCNVERIMTAAIGISAESGEFMEIVKKMVFQGKPWNEENIFHIKRELSDIIFYLQTACLALNISLDDVIKENIAKLESRYPGGKFTVQESENRKEGDL